MRLEIPVHYIGDVVYKLKELSVGDWVDVATQRDIEVVYKPYKDDQGVLRTGLFDINVEPSSDMVGVVKVKLGFSMVLPEGFEAYLLPRSSTFGKYGFLLGNSMGMIDNSYNGINDEWMAMFYATRPIKIEAGTRLAQFRVTETMKQAYGFDELMFIEDDEAFKNNEDRGGFGSTGQ